MESTAKSSIFRHSILVFRSRESGYRQSKFAGTSVVVIEKPRSATGNRDSGIRSAKKSLSALAGVVIASNYALLPIYGVSIRGFPMSGPTLLILTAVAA